MEKRKRGRPKKVCVEVEKQDINTDKNEEETFIPKYVLRALPNDSYDYESLRDDFGVMFVDENDSIEDELKRLNTKVE